MDGVVRLKVLGFVGDPVGADGFGDEVGGGGDVLAADEGECRVGPDGFFGAEAVEVGEFLGGEHHAEAEAAPHLGGAEHLGAGELGAFVDDELAAQLAVVGELAGAGHA